MEFSFVGVGWYLEYRKSKPAPGALWTRLLTGYGRCYGRSAAEAELQAFQSLLFSFHYLNERLPLWPDLPPWRFPLFHENDVHGPTPFPFPYLPNL